MNYLFILQTEGRGHLTQSVALAEMLQARGHQVTEVWAGGNPFLRIPEFISKQYPVRIRRFPSPGFISTCDRKGIMPLLSIFLNCLLVPVHLVSVVWLALRIRFSGVGTIVNFYELTGGIAYRLSFSRKKYVVLSHHFFFEHPAFHWPPGFPFQKWLLRMHNRVCAPSAGTILALSFTPEPDKHNLHILPPLIRKDFRAMVPEEKGHLLVYLLKRGFLTEIEKFCRRNPHVEVKLFVGKEQRRTQEYPQNLSVNEPGQETFMECLRTASYVLSTAGFETTCESALLGKKIFLVPAGNHYEQLCNAADASRAGLAEKVEELKNLAENLRPSTGETIGFKSWLGRSETMIMKILE